jgi:acetylornithine deacetylase/succinyl-diaminopimelate desuccinylase-like protein
MSPGLDGQRILAEAREIAFPRYPGTDGDRRAIARVSRAFRKANLDVIEEEFSYDIRIAFRALRAVLIGSALLFASAGVLAPISIAGSLGILSIGVVAGGVLLVWSPGAERLYARPGPTQTKNVTGYRRATEPRLRLILLAHHDSKSQNLSFPWRMGVTLAATVGGLGLAALLVSGLVVGRLPGPPALGPVLGVTSAVALLALSTLSNGNKSPGGVDNAGSVGILFALARVLPQEVNEDVELVFLSPGAEEDHMVGAMRWLESHEAELNACPVYALNFDGAGAAGKTVLIERYGLGRRFSKTLSEVARRAAGRLDVPFRSIIMPPAMGIDAIPFAHRGVDCLTLSSGRLDRAAISVHASKDVADHLHAPSLERIAALAREVILELASNPPPTTTSR